MKNKLVKINMVLHPKDKYLFVISQLTIDNQRCKVLYIFNLKHILTNIQHLMN